MPKNKHLRFILILFYAALAAAVLWLVVRHVLWLFLPFIIGFVLSRLLLRPVSLLKERLHIPARLSAAVLTLVLCGGLGTGLYFAVRGIISGVVSLAQGLMNFVTVFEYRFADLVEKLESFEILQGVEIGESLVSTLQKLATTGLSSGLLPGVLRTAGSVPQILLMLVAIILSTFFFVSEDAAVSRFIRALLREKLYDRMQQTKKLLFSGLFGWLKAQAILGSVNFAVLTVGFLIIGNTYAPLIALIIAILDILPVLGSGTVLIPWALIALFMGNYRYAIGCAVLYLLCIFVRNLLESRIVGHQIGLHPLVTLMSIYIGYCLFGVIGMFIVPVTALLVVNFNRWGYLRLWENEPRETPAPPAEE
ncbi:MAG: sporulation integral membrane protein YtvI [Clostridia bacterium]|nr:sporulation integral membrane protein YtvI [Clostridia bacterium]